MSDDDTDKRRDHDAEAKRIAETYKGRRMTLAELIYECERAGIKYTTAAEFIETCGATKNEPQKH